MVVTVQKDWPTLWMETVNFFGADLHNGPHLINQLLGVLEKAYKNPDVDWTRIKAFECWKTLVNSTHFLLSVLPFFLVFIVCRVMFVSFVFKSIQTYFENWFHTFHMCDFFFCPFLLRYFFF